jgi:hypothetical protein
MIRSTVLNFKWPLVTLIAALAIYLGDFDPLKPKPLPVVPPASSSTYPPIYVRFFETRSEAEHICGKNNISLVEDAPPDARYVCSDWYDIGPLW